MNTVLLLVLVVFHEGLSSNAASTNVSSRPDVVNVGAVFSFGSTVGRVAKVAIEAALEDVNADPSVLSGTKLKIQMQDTNFSGFLGIVESLRFMESDTVAIIGPQSSSLAHVVSHVANELQVPLLSYSATDPTLSSLQYPFFVRTTQNDLFQISAISEIVEYYGWREVIAIYLDDDQGRNGIATLGDKLAEKRCKISYKAPLPPAATREDITDALVKVALTESRILVIDAHADWGLDVFSVAQYLGMMGTGYVWIATNWLSTILDTNPLLPDSDAMDKIQGVLTLRMHTPDSELKRKFVGRWGNLTSSKTAAVPVGLSTYGLYAYDTVWLLAHAINGFLNQGGNISFSNDSRLADLREGSLHLDAMSIFNGGHLLLRNIFQVNMSGVTGQIKFNSDGSLINPAYEVINVIGGTRRIGYWSNYSGLSLVPPENLYAEPPNHSSTSQKLYDVIWPGQSTQKPRGWVFPNNGRHLRIGVPNHVSFREFVSLTKGSADMFSGYCVDVFTAAINLLPYAVPYTLLPFGDGHNNPSVTELVRLITAGVYDAAIGDIAIIANRTRMVDFTLPYVESGLVVVAPVRKLNSNALAFLRPFTKEMWGVTAIFFIIVGAVVWILEHRINDDFRGPPRKQVVTVLWFSLSTMFFAHKENTISALGRLVLIIWLFVVLIINSSYTASLTSILTVQKLSSPIEGIQTLKESNDPIGYQQASFARNYLIEELNITESRLVALKSGDDYAKALKDGPQKGGVAAVVDERAYIELFLSTRCEFSIVGQEFTKNGWGFAFPRDSPLAVDLSTAILKLSENGDLERIHDKWLMRTPCSLQGAKLEVDRLELKSFWGLFVICGCACLLALFIFFLMIVRQFSQHSFEEAESSNRSSTSTRLQTFLSFVDEKEGEVKIRSKRRQMEIASNRSMDEGESMNEPKRRHIEFSSSKSFNAGYEA